MYTKEDLYRYDYFKDLDLEYILDSLTGCVSRGYIIGFAKYLIDEKKPFGFAIIDLDNFKLINDNYGHQVGDECLKSVAEALMDYVGDKALLGRYGGDEFILIIPREDPTYDNLYNYFTTLYHDKKCFRKSYPINDLRLFVTATAGVASYPLDALDYTELFQKTDKALYRGKQKGRNCYIIFMESKHGNIDVHRRDTAYLPVMFNEATALYNKRDSLEKNIKRILNYLALSISANDIMVITNNLTVDINKNDSDVKKLALEDFDILFDSSNEYIVSNQLKDYKMKSPGINRYMTSTKTQSIICIKLGFGETIGYLAIMENRLLRVWQEREVSFAMYVAKFISFLFELENKK